MSRINVETRNALVKDYVCDKLTIARSKSIADFALLNGDKTTNQLLMDLIYVPANGFRGIVLTAIVGLHIDSNYDPLNSFYACNPRSIFENGIWYALDENNIPCGKSDPLNVAKNINELNESWAEGRRPQKSAMAAVKFLRKLTQETNRQDREELIDYFFFHLVTYAKSIESIEIATADNSELSNQSMASKLVKFILAYPESGTMPQLVIGMILRELFDAAELSVDGDNESVFGTNTTSKKPADIWITKNTVPTNLYEITVKKIDYKRLDDCIDSLRKLDLLDKPITFICRLPIDVNELDFTQPHTVDYKGKKFDFVDISAFIHITLSLLTKDNVINIIGKLQGQIEDIRRPVTTKNGWNEIFSDC